MSEQFVADTADGRTLVSLTAEIVEAYVVHNAVRPSSLPELIDSVFQSLRGLSAPPKAEPEKPVPLMPVRKTLTPDYLISLEDGRRYRTLRRHLSSRGMTPEQYRTKWGLPNDYPMTAPSYTERRSQLAKALGLGQSRAREVPPAAPPAPAPEKAPARRKRAPKDPSEPA